jgi:probable rRNA maturation factor
MPQGLSTTALALSPPRERITLEIHDSQCHLELEPGLLRAWTTHTLRSQGISRASISLALVDDAAIHILNSKFLQHDWPTDVITFPISEPEAPELEGEIVISTQTAQTVARATGADPLDELALYLVHGLLHLCGYDDRDAHAARLMHERQSELLAEILGRPAPPDPAAAGREDGVSQWTA